VKEAIGLAFSFDERVLLEKYISSRELTVGILDDLALPVIEIIPKKRFFDYEAKYKSGMTDYIVPAQLEDGVARKVQGVALKAHRLLGCFGCSRVDILLDKDATPFVLELNTIPGFTPTSLLPKAARVAGIDFAQLCMKLIQLAYERTQVIFSH
jgi:D-alanine-D-alanine ligase